MEQQYLWLYVFPVAIIVICFFAGHIVKNTILKRLALLAKKSNSKLDDVFIESLTSVTVLWFVLLGVYLCINILPLSDKDNAFLEKVFQTLLIFSIFWFITQLIGKIFLLYSEKWQQRIPAASIFKNAIKIFIFSICVMLILQTLGIPITPIITTLGVGGLAVALALQDTLANFFAGFHIIATQRVKPKDYIKLESGVEGYVVDITWRDTVLRQLPNNFVIIPNSRLASAIVVNYYRPKKQLNLLIEVGVDYNSDLEHVEKVTVEVAKDTMMNVPGGVKKFEPFLRYHTFADSSINFTIYLRCGEFFDKFLVQHEFVKRLKKRYDAEGINIPFPIRTILYDKTP
ncbi:MAG: mechanosensitive ion channel family protein [bacterium]|nr:mechanosensitive ion channel family protein [bacterium]